ncbi:MAG: hypothetical protein QXO01_01885 [Nitrososphaerota archaeon]
MKVEVDGVEYEVRTSPKAWPLLALIDDLRLNAPKTLEDADKRGELLERALEKLMENCISPKPPRELWLRFLTIINLVDATAIREASEFFDSFRRRPDTQSRG